jgi:hypothetical protein
VLLTLGVERHDATGAVAADQVDHRVGQLLAPLEHLDLAEEHGLGAHRELAFAPPLVEEAHPQVARPVAHLGGDQHLGWATAGAPGGDAGHGGDDHGLVAGEQVTDGGLAGAVEVPARVVGEQVEHGLHAQLGQAGDLLGLGGQRGDGREREPGQLGEGDRPVGHRCAARLPDRHGDYSMPNRYG